MENIQSTLNTLPCGHRFHSECINKWKDEGKNTCPYCRDKFKENEYAALITLYPRNSRGDIGTLPIPGELVPAFLNQLDLDVEDIDDDGDTINLTFEHNDDLREFFSSIGTPVDSILSDIA